MALPDTIHTPGREETALILQFIVERPERKFNVGWGLEDPCTATAIEFWTKNRHYLHEQGQPSGRIYEYMSMTGICAIGSYPCSEWEVKWLTACRFSPIHTDGLCRFFPFLFCRNQNGEIPIDQHLSLEGDISGAPPRNTGKIFSTRQVFPLGTPRGEDGQHLDESTPTSEVGGACTHRVLPGQLHRIRPGWTNWENPDDL